MTPHRTASGTVAESPLVLIDITDTDGVVGHGLLFTYTPAALQPTFAFVQNLEPLLLNQSASPIEINHMLAKKFRLLGTQGIVGMALAGIDMALWDLQARRQQQSLVETLGCKARPIPCYGGVGYDGESGSAKVAEEWAKIGLLGVKAKIGYPTVAEDLAVVRAMRAAVGPDLAIMVDYNQSLSPSEAIERIRALDHEGLIWVEEPTLAHDYKGHAQIRAAVRTPIQCGENWWGPLDLQHAIDNEASDYLMPDVMKIGGVTGWMQVASIASTRNIQLSSHLWPEISAQLLCATPTAHWLEYAVWWNPIIESPLQIENGYAQIEGVLGSGVAWNEAAIAQL
ncbi:MAG: enolase C-terminal domain-like protein [Pseudomonadota bacterium]